MDLEMMDLGQMDLEQMCLTDLAAQSSGERSLVYCRFVRSTRWIE